MQLMFRNDGAPVQLGPQLTRGGQGAIHLVEGEPQLLAKVYHELPDGAQQHKLRIMVRQQQALLPLPCAWPLHTLHYTAHGAARGFLMRRFDGFAPLHQAYDAVSREHTFPKATWRLQVQGALALARIVAAFHAQGQIIGDLNPNNCLINASGEVALVDCDSHQILANGRIYPCTVAMPEFCAPELHHRNLDRTVRSVAHDSYALAVLVFHVLLMGRHPFAGAQPGRAEPDLLTAMRDGAYVYAGHGHDGDNLPAMFRQLPVAIRAAFATVFAKPQSITERPDAAAWVNLLLPLSENLRMCERDAGHEFAAGAASCPWCEGGMGHAILFASRTAPPHAHIVDVANSAASIKHALRTADLPKPREFAEPNPAPARRAVKLNAWQSRLPLLKNRARRWLGEQHSHAQEVALKWHQVRQSYIDTVQYRSAHRALADCQRRIVQWERDTNSSVHMQKQQAGWRERLTPVLADFPLAEAKLPLLNEPVLAMLAHEGLTTAADLTEHNCAAVSEHSEALAITLWSWRDALERLLCCWLEAEATNAAEAARIRHNMEREIVFHAQRVLGELERARLAEADAAQEVQAADAQYGRVLGELPYLSR